MQNLTIDILTNKTSWMNKHDEKLISELRKMGHKVNMITTKNDLTKGDIAFFLSCFEIIPQDFLDLHKNNIVVHASDLPSGKGWSPSTWQILEGKNEIPITLFEAVCEMDAGDWYLKDKMILDGTELVDEWQDILGEKIVEMCLKYVKAYPNMRGISQTGKESVYPRRKPQDSELDVNKTIAEQFNLLRVVNNEKYPAYFEYKGKKYTLKINLAEEE